MIETKTPLEQVSLLLGRTLLCTLDDGRTVQGQLECLDRLSNIILRDALEKRVVEDPSIYGIEKGYEKEGKENHGKNQEDPPLILERWLSQVLVPGKHLVKVELL
jgi:small nuclear ribonucleoprotein (snRNP)-like protein